MNPIFYKLVNSVRALELKINILSGKEILSIGGNKAEFPSKLIALQKILDELDRSTGQNKDGTLSEGSHVGLYKDTIEALVEMLKSKTQDTRPIHEIVEDAVRNYALESSKKTEHTSSFNFKPSPTKKRDKEVVLNPLGLVPGTVSLDKHKQIGYRSEIAVQGLGSALEDVEKHKERARLRAQKKLESSRENSNDDEPDNEQKPKI